MNRIAFVTKSDSTLGDAAPFVVKKVQGTVPFDLEMVDLSAPGQETRF